MYFSSLFTFKSIAIVLRFPSFPHFPACIFIDKNEPNMSRLQKVLIYIVIIVSLFRTLTHIVQKMYAFSVLSKSFRRKTHKLKHKKLPNKQIKQMNECEVKWNTCLTFNTYRIVCCFFSLIFFWSLFWISERYIKAMHWNLNEIWYSRRLRLKLLDFN